MNRKLFFTIPLTAVLTVNSFCIAGYAAADICGDFNQDGRIDTADVSILAKYLTGEATFSIPDGAWLGNYDLNADNVLNAADLTLLKRAVLANEMVNRPPTAVLSPTMPTRGNVRVPMFLVSFPDCPQTTSLSAAEIQERAFRAEDQNDPAYPLESMTAYFDRASYGRLKLSGDVYEYTAKKPIGEYVDAKEQLIAEVLHAWNEDIDYSIYDADHDSVMDALIVVVPKTADEAWRAVSGAAKISETFDGIKVKRRSIGKSDADAYAKFHSTWLHELSHTMGLPDYYKYTDDGTGPFALNGDAGWELMDDGFGDLSAFSKLLLGWYDDGEVQVWSGGTQTFQLVSGQTAPQCILIPRGDLNGYMSEYFVLEYCTNIGNNAHRYVNQVAYPVFSQGGLRVLHCDAELWDGIWGTELKWNNYGQMYDTGNQKQRVLRLANEAEGGLFFRTGDIVDGTISGFHWYDADGLQTVDTGVKITVDQIADGICTLTISE